MRKPTPAIGVAMAAVTSPPLPEARDWAVWNDADFTACHGLRGITIHAAPGRGADPVVFGEWADPCIRAAHRTPSVPIERDCPEASEPVHRVTVTTGADPNVSQGTAF